MLMARRSGNEIDLDVLAECDVAELTQTYRTAQCPDAVDILRGYPRGRMLSVRYADSGPLFAGLRAIARDARFPWEGKSFFGTGKTGTGINRVHLFGRHHLFPFETRIGPSSFDGSPCVILDYDLADNPSFIRSIHDEVREVGDGVFLGPAMWKTAGDPAFALWFGLDTRVQAPPVGPGNAP